MNSDSLSLLADSIPSPVTSEVLRQASIKILSMAGLYEHALSDWEIVVNSRPKSRRGLCNYGKKTIEVSGFVAKAGARYAIRTLAHEMAHALIDDRLPSHGREWSRMARKLGHPGTRLDPYKIPPEFSPTPTVVCTSRSCSASFSIGPIQAKRFSSGRVNYVCPDCRSPIQLVKN